MPDNFLRLNKVPFMLLFLAACAAGLPHRGAAPLRSAAASLPGQIKLMGKIKQIAEAVRAKHATVDNVAAPIGPWKLDEFLQCELSPRDPEFREGRIDTDRNYHNPHTPKGKQPIESVDLTLAKGVVLTPHMLERTFGKWRTVPPPPEGNPYQVVFYYPDDKAVRSTAVFAEMNGLPQKATTRVTSLFFRRDVLANFQ